MAYKFKHPIRLIELFAGYGSQALALKYLNIPMEHWFVCEFDKYAMTSYNEIHGTNFEVSDIKDIKAKDLNIINTDEYKYCLTYSFPCTDLSVAGKMKGMQRESGTSSSLLWEVERLLKECDELPQYLLMENVPQVISNDNLPLFKEWTTFLSKLGYDNYYKLLNAKDFGVAQNRNRCFMVSILKSEHKDFKFPKIKPLTKKMKDYLEDVVDEKYYINNDKAKALIEKLIIDGELDGNKTTCDLSLNSPESIDVANCIKARYDAGISNFKSDGSGVVETISLSNQGADYDGKIDESGQVSPTLTSCGMDGIVRIESQYRIRKLTPKECFRLMGVRDEDFHKLSASNSQLYKQAGNSIVVDVLMAIFENMFIKDCKINKLF